MIEKDVVFTGANSKENARILAQSFADVIGWTVESYDNGAYVKGNGIPIYFIFEGSGNNIYVRLSNGIIEIGGSTYYFTASNSFRYAIWVVKTRAGTVAFGVNYSSSNILRLQRTLNFVIAQNESGQYTGFMPKSTSSDLWLYINADSTKSKEYDTGEAPSGGHPNKSIIRRVADVEYKSLFKDLYEIVILNNISGVYKYSISLYANGTYYRTIGSKESNIGIYRGTFAVPDIT